MKRFKFLGAWRAHGWTEPAFVEVDDRGIIAAIADRNDKKDFETVAGWAVPGVLNAHSHAFQYAMAGLAEHLPTGKADDDFWSWRETMYSQALSVTPDSLRAIATLAYAEMVRRGFTSVVEFHYLHHQEDGGVYTPITKLAETLAEAASQTGIRLTLVPVHYRTGDFGTPASRRQRRFLFESADAYLKFADQCAAIAKTGGHEIGGGVHSLRASPAEDTIRIFRDLPKHWPRHLHIAEQLKEVESCQKHLRQRPIEWLLKNVDLDPRFYLVHCTHANPEEVTGLAKSKAHVVLCPTTEGNLGDGVFPLVEFWEAGGRFLIGTDSHVGLDPWEELRWADYQQRLRLHKRNPLCKSGEESGDLLLRSVVNSHSLSVGASLDALVLDGAHPLWERLKPAHRISNLIYAPAARPPLGTLIAGKWIARDGRHLKEDAFTNEFRKLFGARA